MNILEKLLGKSQQQSKVKKVTAGLFDCSTDFLHQNEAAPHPESFDPLKVTTDQLLGGYKVIVKKRTKKMTLFRFLLAKMVYEEEGIHLDEFIILSERYFEFLESRDPSFRSKYIEWFEENHFIFIEIFKQKSFPYRIPDKAQKDTKRAFAGLLPSQQAYYGLKGQRDLRKSYKVVLNSQLQPQRLKSKRFIGVGYRDKGTARNDAEDGTPSWKVVASYNCDLERIAEELLQEEPPDVL